MGCRPEESEALLESSASFQYASPRVVISPVSGNAASMKLNGLICWTYGHTTRFLVLGSIRVFKRSKRFNTEGLVIGKRPTAGRFANVRPSPSRLTSPCSHRRIAAHACFI